MTELRGLTPRQRDVVEAVAALTKNGVAPSYRDLLWFLGYASTSTAHRHVQACVKRGWLSLNPCQSRSVRLTDAARKALRETL